MNAASMQLACEDIVQVIDEPELYQRMLELDGRTIVELGCGSAAHTRILATGGPARRITAFDVDRAQLREHLAVRDLPNVDFRYGGAEHIDCASDSVDVVFLFKSLHHVAPAALDTALEEIARILRPGGFAWISEPVFAGAFNDIVQLFHDEAAVRRAAFEAICRAVERDTLDLAEEIFFLNPVSYADFGAFERRVLHATHTRHRLDEFTLARVRALFESHLGPQGALFHVPMRVDLMHKPRR